MSDISGNDDNSSENVLNLRSTMEGIDNSLNILPENETNNEDSDTIYTGQNLDEAELLSEPSTPFERDELQIETESKLSEKSLTVESLASNGILEEHKYLYQDLKEITPIPMVYYRIKQALMTNNIETALDLREMYMETQQTKNNQEEQQRGGFPKEFEIFKYEFLATRRNNTHVLDESKQCKRFLDLKYNDLVNIINRIQTSVIFTSTISGFMQATKTQFNFGEVAISIVSITIATYISLVLSISKYYGLDDLKERIQLLREKYSLLLNEIDYNMDKLGPWTYRKQWIKSDAETKMLDWKKDYQDISQRYNEIIATKKELTSEYEDIMDTKSRNYYDIENKKLSIKNKERVYKWTHKEDELEKKIAMDKKKMNEDVELNQLEMKKDSIVLQTEENDNWTYSDWTEV